MVARARMDSTGFKVSKPGVNVNSATLAQLSFDTNQSVMLWYTALHARPPGPPFSIAYSYPALPWAPCFNFQLYFDGAWNNGGFALGFFNLFNMNSNSEYQIVWNAMTTATGPLEYVRINIFNLKGEP